MGDLDFNIAIGSEEKQKPTTPMQNQPDSAPAVSEGSLLSRSSHPVACVFHFAFKLLAFFAYLFLNAALGNATLTFIVIVTFAALDFWTV